MAETIEPELLAESQARSYEYFTNPDSYAGFTLTKDMKLIIACIEPRDPANAEHGDYKITMQTPGGFMGEGLDQALASYAVDKEAVRIRSGMDQDAKLRISKTLDMHQDCAFHGNVAHVVKEMARPGDFTKDSLFGWAERFNKREEVAENLGRISMAADAQLDVIAESGDDDLLAVADSLQPGHPNVYGVKWRPMARTYVMNFHPHIGKNRNRKPADPELAGLVQGYHDNIAAMVCDLETAFSLSGEMRGLRLGSLLLRSAATRTVITRDKMDGMTFLNVKPDGDTESGLDISQGAFL